MRMGDEDGDMRMGDEDRAEDIGLGLRKKVGDGDETVSVRMGEWVEYFCISLRARANRS